MTKPRTLRVLSPEPRAPATSTAPQVPPPGSLRVGLVNMPFSSTRRPSIQIGLLQAILEAHDIEAHSHYLNLRFAARIGLELHDELCTRSTTHQIGDWLFSRAAFGDELPPTAAYLERFGEHLEEVCAQVELRPHARLGRRVQDLAQIRDHEVPAFLDECLEQTAWGDYDVVGFTSVFQQNCAALALARRIKERHPEVVVVFGGANFEDEMGLEYVRTVPWIDYAVIGEGDVAFLALLAHIAAGNPDPRVQGVAYRYRGQVVDGGRAPTLDDLDGSPDPNYDDFFTTARQIGLPATVLGKELMLPFEAARGCWWGQKHHCTFCGLNKTRMAFRSKSSARVLEQIEGLARRYGIQALGSTDNILDWKYIPEIFGPLSEQRKDYTICVDLKTNMKQEHLRALARGGVRFAQPGVESLNTHLLSLMDKGVTKIQNVRFLKWARYYGISVAWHILRGFPGETEEDYADQLATMRLIPHLQPPCPKTIPIRIDKFSPNYDRAAEIGFRDVRPCISYDYIYPPRMDQEKVACYFQYSDSTALPAAVYREHDEHLGRWHAAWHGPRRPSLVYERGPDRVRITDRRDPSSPEVHDVRGTAALVYELCGPTYLPPHQLRAQLAARHGHDVEPTVVREALDDLVARRLMLEEDGRYLSLALPINRYW